MTRTENSRWNSGTVGGGVTPSWPGARKRTNLELCLPSPAGSGPDALFQARRDQTRAVPTETWDRPKRLFVISAWGDMTHVEEI